VERKADNTKHRKRIRSHSNKYALLCREAGVRSFPPSYKSVALYICRFVEGLGGSAKSIHNVVSYLRVFCHYCKVPWLSEGERYKLGVVCKQLQFEDLLGHKQARPITHMLLLRMLDTIDFGDQQEFLTMMLMFMAHDGLLRSCELFAGMEVGDVEWCEDNVLSFVITVWRSKANRSGPAELVRVVDHVGPSAYKMLRLWFRAHNLFQKHRCLIIPRVVFTSRRGQGNAYRLDFTLEATTGWWDNVIKLRTSKIGLDSSKYTGHSFRPGGATDLFSMGVPYPVVMDMGRWKSDAVIKYLRDSVMVAQMVADAFGRLAKKQQGRMGECEGPSRGDLAFF
jgi:hypothetical protein